MAPGGKVYVGGLPPDATSEEIEDAFSRYGRIFKVWVARRPPGFAFVEFDDERDAEDAVKGMDGTRICGVHARVELSNGRNRGGGGDRGGRGYGGGRGGGYGGGRDRDGYDGGRDRDRRRSRSRSPRRDRSRSRSPRRSPRGSPSPHRERSRSRSRAMSLPQLGSMLARLSLSMPSSSRMMKPVIRCLSTSTPLSDSIRDAHRQGTRVVGEARDVMDGTSGSRNIAVSLGNLAERLPTAATLKQLFDGIPYNELPTVYIKATKNNTLVTVTDHKHKVLTYTSCRLEGFKNARKKTTIAGQTTGVAAGQRLVRRGIRTVRVQVKGLGPGRMTSVKGLAVAGVNVISITDHTALPELGPRPKKIRRI